MEEMSEEIQKQFNEKYNRELMQLIYLFKSMDYGIDEMMIIISLFLGSLMATEKIDEEDLRNLYRCSSMLKDRIVFK